MYRNSQPTMAQIHEAFKIYLQKEGLVDPRQIKWKRYKSLLLSRMTEDAKKHG